MVKVIFEDFRNLYKKYLYTNWNKNAQFNYGLKTLDDGLTNVPHEKVLHFKFMRNNLVLKTYNLSMIEVHLVQLDTPLQLWSNSMTRCSLSGVSENQKSSVQNSSTSIM